MSARKTRDIEGELFGANAVPERLDSRTGEVLAMSKPPIVPSSRPEVLAVRDSPSTIDSRVQITKDDKDRFHSAECPQCGYSASEWSRADCRQAYVFHRAQERAAIPDLFDGESFGGQLKPYSEV